jgi:hypothetical protein
MLHAICRVLCTSSVHTACSKPATRSTSYPVYEFSKCRSGAQNHTQQQHIVALHRSRTVPRVRYPPSSRAAPAAYIRLTQSMLADSIHGTCTTLKDNTPGVLGTRLLGRPHEVAKRIPYSLEERTTYKFPCTLLKEAAEFACPDAPGPASSRLPCTAWNN